jgi:collagen type VII alpha
VSYPALGIAVEGTPFREPQSCLGPAFAGSTYQFFLTGTSTPANIYQDGALTTPFPITGYVTADNYGRFPPIYLDPSVIYRVQFFNSANVQLWQLDPYTSQLSTVGTSALSAYGFQIAATGEVTVLAPNTGGSGVSLTPNSGALGSVSLKVVGTLAGNSAIIVNNSATTGTRTATFTATNKPGTATSSPAGWLPITCDGVQYYTPIWHGNPFTPYTPSPSAQGEMINATSVTFTGSGLTTVTGGTATPSNWYAPASPGTGASYYINITKTGGLSGLAFSAAQGAWTNIGSGGLTISSNAQAAITGTYQISTSVSGTPLVASGTITLSGGNGVQSTTYNGATPLALAGNGTATLNGVSSTNWFLPTTANVGASYWVNIMQTGGTSGYTFSAASGAWTNITNGGLSIGISGPAGSTYSVTGTYQVASDSGGVNVLGSGSITLTGGSNVQSPNYSGTTPLVLAGNGAATLNGAGAGSWYSPNASSVGAGYYIDITRTGGTTGVNFTAAQGSWTNITNSGLSVGISGYTGDVGTVTATGTYQISNSGTGMPVLGSGTVSLSVVAGTVIHVYTTAVTSATETIPTNTTTVRQEVWGSGGGGSGGHGTGCASMPGLAGGCGGFSYRSYAASALGGAGKTFRYTITNGGAGGGFGASGTAGTAGSIVAGTVTGYTTMTGNGGGGATISVQGAGGTASGGTTNTTGATGSTVGTTGSITGDGSPYGGGGANGHLGGSGGAGAAGAVVFYYS